MTTDIAIRAENISKVYKLYDNPVDRLKESIHPFRKKYHRDFYALKDINFEIAKGETVGIIGKNGSGKSTLLKILTGVLTPSSGRVIANGKISALLELGTGFNPELTGIENIYFSGTIMGYSREEMDAKLDQILSFDDIGEFVYQPVKTYSSGMFVRLAFSVSAIVKPEIFIVDEALAVGDMFFQAKCMNKMKVMLEHDGMALLFVSHDMNSIKSICENSILLKNGELAKCGRSKDVVNYYHSLITSESTQSDELNKLKTAVEIFQDGNQDENKQIRFDKAETDKRFSVNDAYDGLPEHERYGDKKIVIRNVQVLDENCTEVKEISLFKTMIFRFHIEFFTDSKNYNIGFLVRNINGIEIFGFRTAENIRDLPYKKKGDKAIVDFKLRNFLQNGIYIVSAAVSDKEKIFEPNYHDWINTACVFKSTVPQNTVWGLVCQNIESVEAI